MTRKALDLLHLLEQVYDTVLLGFPVNDDKVNKLQEDLKQLLAPFNPEMPHALHISLAYVLKKSVTEELADVLEDAKHYNVSFEALNLAILPGVNAPVDFLVIKLKPSEGFFQLLNAVNKIAETKQMPGGFKSHLSLLKFKKGALGDIKEKILGKDKFKSFTIKPEAIALWNDKAEVSKQVSLS